MPLLVTLLVGLALGEGGGPPATPWDDLGAEELALLRREAAAWIVEQRDRHRPAARRLDAAERRALAGFFAPELLDEARVRRVERIENPGFYSRFEETGRPIPIDFRRAAGIALLDTVLVVAPPSPELLFHELVHLAQYRHLGLERYVERYVGGWAESGHSYRAIPLEVQAYQLAERFRRAPNRPFEVTEEVRRRFPRAGGG